MASVDFSPLGVSSYLVEVYDGNSLVKTFSGHSGQNIGYQNCPSLLAPTAKSIPGIDITAKKGRPVPSDRTEARLSFGGCTQFDFGAGNGVSQGDRLVLTSATEVTYTEKCVLSTARITGKNYGQFGLSSMGVIALNHPFQALGEATLGAFGNTMTIANNKSSGQDGASIVYEEPGVKVFSIGLLPFADLALPEGAYLQGSMRGTLNGIPDQALGTMRETQSRTTWFTVTSDFGSLMPSTRSVTIYNKSAPVLVVDGFTGAVDASSGWKTYSESKTNTAAGLAVNAAPAARTKLGGQTSNTLTMAATYPANTVFKINGTEYVGDQLEFKAVGGVGTAIGDFSDLRLTAADIPEFTILDVQTVPEDNPPTITAAAVTRTAGSPGSTSTIASVNDTEDAENTLSVKVNNAVTATVNGVTVSGLSVDSKGLVTANVIANCGATNASFALNVTDSFGTAVTVSLDVTVTPNPAPVLSYATPQTVAAGGALTINPLTGPTDNIGVSGILLQNAGTYTGGIAVNNTTGVVTLTGAKPGGTHTITIRITDNCATPTDATFTLNITCPTITVNPATLVNSFVGTAYNQTLTASGGVAPYTFGVTTGKLPGGLTLASGGALTGTHTAAGSFNFTVTATDANGCTGTRAYTVIISGGGLQFYPLTSPVRALETRAPFSGCVNPGAPINANTSFTLAVRTGCTGIPANAAAVTGNVTVVPSATGGYLTLFPSSATQPIVANSNFKPGEVTNNVFTAGLGAGDGAFKIFTSATTEVIVDITGYYAPPGANGLYFHPLPEPVRLVETRTLAGLPGCLKPGAPLTGGQDFAVQGRSPVAAPCNAIPAGAQVLVGNATSVFANGAGFLTIFPSDATRPLIASSNYAGGDIINGPFAVKLGADGKFKVNTHQTTDLVIDILGYYSTEATDSYGTGLLFTPLGKPVRLLETRADFPGLPLPGCYRPNAKIPSGTAEQSWGTCEGLTIPTTARAIIGNATVVNVEGVGFLTFYPGNVGTAPTVATELPLPGVVRLQPAHHCGCRAQRRHV